RKPIAVGHRARPRKPREDEGRLHEAFLQGECFAAIERRPWEATVAVVAREGGAIERLRVLRGAGVVVEVPGLAARIDRAPGITVLVVTGATRPLEQERRDPAAVRTASSRCLRACSACCPSKRSAS